jgi:hypothetical protein
MARGWHTADRRRNRHLPYESTANGVRIGCSHCTDCRRAGAARCGRRLSALAVPPTSVQRAGAGLLRLSSLLGIPLLDVSPIARSLGALLHASARSSKRRHRIGSTRRSSHIPISAPRSTICRGLRWPDSSCVAACTAALTPGRVALPALLLGRRRMVATVWPEAAAPPRGTIGEQIERNPEQLRAIQRRLHQRTRRHATGSLRLGAGRSQVQILSPRLESPAIAMF